MKVKRPWSTGASARRHAEICPRRHPRPLARRASRSPCPRRFSRRVPERVCAERRGLNCLHGVGRNLEILCRVQLSRYLVRAQQRPGMTEVRDQPDLGALVGGIVCPGTEFTERYGIGSGLGCCIPDARVCRQKDGAHAGEARLGGASVSVSGSGCSLPWPDSRTTTRLPGPARRAKCFNSLRILFRVGRSSSSR